MLGFPYPVQGSIDQAALATALTRAIAAQVDAAVAASASSSRPRKRTPVEATAPSTPGASDVSDVEGEHKIVR